MSVGRVPAKVTNARREKVYFLMLQGNNAPAIAKIINSPTITVYKDIQFLTEKSKEYVWSMAKGSHALMYQKCIQGIELMLSECWKKFNDSKVSNKDKATFLRLGFDCQRAIFQFTNEGPASMMLTSLIERAKRLGIDYEDNDNNNIIIPISKEDQIANYSRSGLDLDSLNQSDNANDNNDISDSEPTNQNQGL